MILKQQVPENSKREKTDIKTTKKASDSKCQQGKEEILEGPCASKKRKLMGYSEKKCKKEEKIKVFINNACNHSN